MNVLDLVVPPACTGCGRVGAVLCTACRSRVRPASVESDRFVVADASLVVGDALLVAVSACAYGGAVRRALAALKYRGVSRVAPILASLALPALDHVRALTGRAALVPVPIHAERRALRGYNQAELLARALAKKSGMRVADVLERTRPTTKQHRLNRSARLSNLRGAFVARCPVPATAILVDDIITTSATLEACAAALRASGAEAVYGVAIAREI